MAEDKTFKLTNQNIEAYCPLVQPPARRAMYWDSEMPGFGLVVGRSSRSFIAQKDVAGRTVRVTIGRYGKVWTAERARKEAVQLLAEMDRGGNPNKKKREAKARGVTLEQAVEMHVADMRKYRRAERSILDFRYGAERLLSDWLKRPLEEITRGDCRARHERLTKTSGPYSANRTLSVFRAAYNTAATLPTPPRWIDDEKFRDAAEFSSELMFFRPRYYDPTVGRFTRLDPAAGSLASPLTLHKYGYANGNPISGIDPSGLFTLKEGLVATGIGAVLIGLTLTYIGGGNPLSGGKAVLDQYSAGTSFPVRTSTGQTSMNAAQFIRAIASKSFD